MTPDTGSRRPSVRRRLVATGSTAAALACAAVLGLLAWLRVPLHVVLGGTFPVLCLATASGLVLATVVLAREVAAWRRGEPGPPLAAPFQSLFVVAVGSWLAFLAVVEPFEKLWLLLAVGPAAAAWAAWIAAGGIVSRIPPGIRKATGVLCFGLAAGALLLEIVLRIYAAANPSPLLARLGDPPRVTVERTRLQPGQVRFGKPANRTGHYDDEFYRRQPGERLVASIGDSFSIGVVPHACHFTTVCERALGIPVDNLGIAGVGPPEYLDMLVDEALPLDPDVVVIDVFVGNDFDFPTTRRGELRALAESWFQRGNVLLWVVPQRLSRLAEERRRRAQSGKAVAVVQGESDRGTGPVEALYPWIVDPSLEEATFSPEAYLDLETVRARKACRVQPHTLGDFFDIFRQMKRAVGPIRLCVMLIPDEFQVEDQLWASIVEATPGEELDRDRPQRVLLSWFAEQGIPCLDLLPLFRAVPPGADGRRHLYHLRDTHFNARGNRVAGEALAEFLVPIVRSMDWR